MTLPSTAGPDLQRLRDRLTGDVVSPADPGWDAARQAWNLISDQHPACVVLAETAADVAETVRFAAQAGLRVAPQGTGHGSSTLADLPETILLRTSRMAAVTVDAGARTARVEAGALWGDVVGPAAAEGLAALHGSSGTVGVTGYTLAGGVGWLARSRGLACNNVAALEVVTTDGEQRRVDAATEPDLFWALRGGGSSAAIVTALEIELVELREAFAGQLMWPIEQAAAVAHAWRAWTETVPDALTSTLKLVRFPPLPQLPDVLRGRALVVVALAFDGDAQAGAELVAPLRAVAEPYLDTLGVVPAPALTEIAGDPVDPLPGRGNGFLLTDLDDAAIDAYVALAGPDAQVPLIHLELRHLGGALSVSSPDHGALDAIDARYMVYGVGIAMAPQLDDAIRATLAAVRERLAPWTATCSLLGFAEQQPGIRGSFPSAVADRLAAVKADYDPAGLIVANHVND